MKYLKQFEISKRNNRLLIKTPEVGDLVVGFITARKGWNLDLKWYLNNTVAEVDKVSGFNFTLKYDTIPEGFEEYFTKFPSDNYYTRKFGPDELRFAEPKEKREFLLKKQRDKFNL